MALKWLFYVSFTVFCEILGVVQGLCVLFPMYVTYIMCVKGKKIPSKEALKERPAPALLGIILGFGEQFVGNYRYYLVFVYNYKHLVLFILY